MACNKCNNTEKISKLVFLHVSMGCSFTMVRCSCVEQENEKLGCEPSQDEIDEWKEKYRVRPPRYWPKTK